MGRSTWSSSSASRTHLELQWESPPMAHFFERLSLVLAPDHLRQARQRAVRPRHRGAHPRAADRRRPGGDGRGRVGAGGPLRDLRGRPDERAVRRHSSRARRRRSCSTAPWGAPPRRPTTPGPRPRRRFASPPPSSSPPTGGRTRRGWSSSSLRASPAIPRRPSTPPVLSARPRARRWSSRSSRCSSTSMCEPSCPRSMFRRSSPTGAATGWSTGARARSSPRRSRAPATSSYPGSTTSPGQATRTPSSERSRSS